MRTLVFVVALLLPVFGGWGPWPPAAGAQEADIARLPEGPGRETVFYTCAACHSIRLVAQQRMDRVDWDETLHYMVEEQDMPEPDAEDRKILLDYLVKYLGRDVAR